MVTDSLSCLLPSMAIAGGGILIAGAVALLWDIGFLFFLRHARSFH